MEGIGVVELMQMHSYFRSIDNRTEKENQILEKITDLIAEAFDSAVKATDFSNKEMN